MWQINWSQKKIFQWKLEVLEGHFYLNCAGKMYHELFGSTNKKEIIIIIENVGEIRDKFLDGSLFVL